MVATPTIDPTIRIGLVIAALAVLLIWGLYPLTTADSGGDETADGHVGAD